MTILIVFSVLILLAFLWLLLLKADTSFVIANGLYNSANKLEAKLAKLKHYSIWNKEFDIESHYLSNVLEFDNTKPIIVLLHGFSADKYIWNRIAKRLTNQYQIFAPDLLGHGDVVYRKTDTYSTPEQVRFLLSMLNKLNIKKFHIIGNSMGGLMTAKMLEICPRDIGKAVLIDPAGIKSDFSLEMAKSNKNPFNHYNEADFFYFYDLVMAKPPYMPRFILRAIAYKYISKREQYVHMFRDFFNPDDFFDLSHRIESSDVMLIWGVNDKLMPVADYITWQEMLDSTTVIYEDLGHMAMVEDVKRVSKDIMLFLENKS
ncbi:alpha/beta fold hydrolase [Glaciecola sp.]|jgi:abhydrolase domain-containing protein 6|uniref:alpha/beta fold hydrolase n=1 Tax=Glaciecola sp. MF2-115 TaxID=3384827 RepID=UPI003988F953